MCGSVAFEDAQTCHSESETKQQEAGRFRSGGEGCRIRSQTSEFKGDNTTVCGDGSERSAGINDHVGAATRTLEAVSSKIAGRSLNGSTGDFVAARIIERQRISWINGAPEHSQRGLRSGKREGDGTQYRWKDNFRKRLHW